MGLNPIGIIKPTYTYLYSKILTHPVKLRINEPSILRYAEILSSHIGRSSIPQASKIPSRPVNLSIPQGTQHWTSA